MPQQYMLINRPITVNMSSIRSMLDGRRPNSIRSDSSMSPYISRLVVKDSKLTKYEASIQSRHKLEPASAVSLVEYQKSVQDNLISINNNLSDMLKETVSGIDIICQKVRLCLLEANSVDSIKMRNSKQLMCIWEEKIDKPEDIEEEAISEIVEEETPDEDTNKIEEEIEVEPETQKSSKDLNSVVENSTETQKRNSSLTPFYTILNPKTLSAESVVVKELRSITSKLGLSRKCTAENFQKSMQEAAKLNNYESVLSRMVKDVNEGINRYYKNYKEECKSREIDRSMDLSLESQDSSSFYKIVKMNEKIKKLQNDVSSKMKQDFNNNRDIRSTLKIATSNIKEKIEKLQDVLKIHTAKKSGDVSLGNITFPCREVYRKKAFTDLNNRMNMQVEANDSFICFQKLMDKNKEHMTPKSENDKPSEISLARSPLEQILINEQRQRQNRRNEDLAKMYQDSLWFKGKSKEEKRTKKECIFKKKLEAKSSKNEKCLPKKLEGKSSKNEKCLPNSYTIKSVANIQDKSYSMKIMGRSSKHSTKSAASVSNNIKKIMGKSSKLSTKSVASVSTNNIKKIMRKSSKHSTKSVASVSANNVKKIPTKYEISITNNQPLSEPGKSKMFWLRTKYAQLTKKKLEYIDILDNITNKDILPLQSEYPRRDQVVTKAKVDNVKDSYLYKLLHAEENEQVWAELLKSTTKCSNGNCEKCSQTEIFERTIDFDKEKIRRALSKYIFADVDQIQRNQVFTVMPVQVSYDNSRIAANQARRSLPQKLPLLPMKETNDDIRRAEWSSENNKKPKPKKVVFDPILRKIEKEIKMVTTRQESKHVTTKLAITTSWSPKNFNQLYATTRQASGFKTVKVDSLDKASKKPQSKIVPNQSCKPTKIIERRPRKRLAASTEQSAVELDIEKNIQKELEIQSSKLRNIQERKIWENKYGKSVGQKLINFVEKQPSVYEIPVPKYALPKTIKNPTAKRQMLDKLRVLKQKNDSIQSNIVQAIQVIENKMMDVLSKPAESIEAFEKMEQEITQVLSLMKTCKEGSQEEPLPQIEEQYSDMNQLSEDLFKRLDMILQQQGSAEKSAKKSKRKMKANRQQKSSSNDMQTVCFSSLSSSGEEKFTITAISPRTKCPIIPRPKIIMPTVTTNDKEFEAINSKLRKLQNDLGLAGCSDELEIGLLENIEEKNVEQKKAPITNAVINIALVKHKYAGDTNENVHTFNSESPSHSIGDGHLRKCISKKIKESTEDKAPNNPDERYSSQYVRELSQEVVVSNEQSRISDTQKLSDVVTDEEILSLEGCTDLLEQYYTPITSPLDGIRDIELFQQVEPHNSGLELGKLQVEPHSSGLELEKPLEGLNEEASSTDPEGFYDYFNKIIARVESVYTQLAEFEEMGLEGFQEPEQYLSNIPVFHDPPKNEDFEADSFLTPFMHAVKDLRESVKNTPKSRPSSPILYRSPSFFNVLSFLDTLTDLEERAVEIQTARVLHYSYSCHNSTVFQQAIIQNQSTTEPVQEPQKIPECLKKSSSYSSVITETTTQSQYGEINVPKKISGCLKKTLSYSSMITKTSTTQSDEAEINASKKTSSYLSMITAISSAQSNDEEINVPDKNVGSLKIPSSYSSIRAEKNSGCLEKQSSHSLIKAKSTAQSEGVKKISSCLKNPSSHLSVITATSKSKQKVSFVLEKDEKAIQVVDCLVQKLSSRECLSSLIINNKDEQVSAYLDVLECKSVDKMSLSDDYDSFKSNSELYDEISLEPEQILQNSAENKKNVGIFRNNIPEKYKGTRMFYNNNYEQTDEPEDNFNYQTQIINGKFNETSILQAKKYLIKDGIDKIFKNIRLESILKQMLKESSLLEPLKDVHSFIDTKLLKDTIEERQKIRNEILINNKNEKCCHRERETFLKGVYICVYLFMFTALKLNLNLECCVD